MTPTPTPSRQPAPKPALQPTPQSPTPPSSPPSQAQLTANEHLRWLLKRLHDRYIQETDFCQGEKPRPARVIVVVGAGASGWSGLPGWESFKEPLLQVIEQSIDFDLFAKQCWAQLAPTLGPMPATAEEQRALLLRASIEDLTGVASQFSIMREVLVAELVKSLRRSPPPESAGDAPQLGYELLSHLLKHGFIDHLVSFNFDEILDNAVRNELGRDEYVRVVPENDDAVLDIDHALPYLIKPHGSLTEFGTMKFAGRDTLTFTAHTTRLLDWVLLKQRPMAVERRHTERPERRPVYIVSLGYSWNDPDFANWVMTRAQDLDEILIVSRTNERPERLRGIDASKIRVLSTVDLFKQDPSLPIRPSIDHLIWAVWGELHRLLTKVEPPVPVMPAARHILLGYLFGPNLNAACPLNDHTVRARSFAELLLHVAKGKGMVNTSVMAHDHRIQQYVARAGRKENTPPSKHDLLRNAGLVASDYPDVRETYFSEAKDVAQLAQPYYDAFTISPILVPKYEAEAKCITMTRLQPQQFVPELIGQVFAAPEVEVSRTADPRCEWIFRSSKPLPRYLELHHQTRALLAAPWSHLFVIAESGAWLTDPYVSQILLDSTRQRKILLLQSFVLDSWPLREHQIANRLAENWELLRKANCEVIPGTLPWWRHNRHMSLAFDQRGQGLLGGIYFRRHLKASRIHPVACGPEDCGELLLSFLHYVVRALARKRDADNERLRLETIEAAGAAVEAAITTCTWDVDLRERLEKQMDRLRDSLPTA